jgi:predicted nucleic acid-binding protein
LPQQGKKLHIVPQVLIELWVVATRPTAHNGLGLAPAAAAIELRRLKSLFHLLPETPSIYDKLESLATVNHVSGKTAHDARLVAAMQVYGLMAILTYDKDGFSRYAGIEVVHPDAVLA